MPRLFISCVSNEFASYRDAIRRDFTRPNLDTEIQEDFIATGGPTLKKPDDYIQYCEAVIHICGDMAGSMAMNCQFDTLTKNTLILPGVSPPCNRYWKIMRM